MNEYLLVLTAATCALAVDMESVLRIKASKFGLHWRYARFLFFWFQRLKALQIAEKLAVLSIYLFGAEDKCLIAHDNSKIYTHCSSSVEGKSRSNRFFSEEFWMKLMNVSN